MKRCDWCDEEFNIDDAIKIGKPKCEEHGKEFCSDDCLNEHMLNEEDC